jgi:phage terminase small subunit
MALTAKQQAFCEHYVANGFNATQAAISAGYSETSAKQIASINMTKHDVQERIASFKEEAVERALVTVEDAVRGLLAETVKEDEDSTPATRIAAWKALTDYTGGFDSNKVHNVNVEVSHEDWLESLK